MKLHSGLVIVGLLSLGLFSYSCANGDTVSGSTGTGGSSSTGTGGSNSTGTGGSNSTGTGGSHTGGTTGTGGSHTGGSNGTGGIISGTGGSHTGGTTGTGGTVTGTGGTVVTGTGGTTTASCGSTFEVGINGFVTMPAVGGGCWTGFASDGGDAGSTIMPGTFATCGSPCMLTMTGTLNASTAANSYAGYSYLGFNIGQDSGGAAVAAVAPKGSGITVTFTNTSAAPVVRVALNADATGTTSWCAPVTTSPATIPYTSFTQACYTPGGAAYAKQPIMSIQLSVPGGATSGPVNVTLVSVKENP
jgi:hypothetical protein